MNFLVKTVEFSNLEALLNNPPKGYTLHTIIDKISSINNELIIGVVFKSNSVSESKDIEIFNITNEQVNLGPMVFTTTMECIF